MDYPAYERAQELALGTEDQRAQSARAVANLQYIMSVYTYGDTLASLARSAYKCTDAGVSVGFRLLDGTRLWNGDSRQSDPALIESVEAICISSIVEGSDAEVPGQWITLADYETPEAAYTAWLETLDYVDKWACELWEEEHAEEEEEDYGAPRWEPLA